MADSVTQHAPVSAAGQAAGRGARFLANVMWNWLGVATNLAVGLLLSPYIIHKLGEERYGIWALIFSVLDYFWFFDLGLNTAVTNFCARYLARREPEKINEVINTALFYFSLIAMVIAGITLALAGNVEHFFHISPAYRREFATLVTMTGVSWALCVVLHLFVSALDGFQRFDMTSRVWVATLVVRSSGYAVLLAFGFGLVEMGAVFVVVQVLGYIMNFRNFRRAFPDLRFARRYVRLATFKEIVGYGVNSFVANSSGLLLNQSGPVLIGHFLPAAFVGFFALPARLLQYAVDAVSRIGIVTRSSAADLRARGLHEDVVRLGIYSNRYSFTLFAPIAIALLVYGKEVIRLWVGPEFALRSAPLLPVFLLANGFVLAGQFNSSSILFGINRHGGYARGLLLEGILNVAGLWLVIPRFGILGAACYSSVLMLAVRGIYTPWLLCRSLDYSLPRYMWEIYMRPVVTAVPVLALAWVMKAHWIAGRNWLEVVTACALVGIVYCGLALLTCFEPGHRELLVGKIPVLGPPLRDRLARG